ncbi:diguanylate cyclase [Aestuariibacter halophilus]|uniref:diguanylate cyclase n=1 Tax=Fluctibacter halophilus TaxID=226011 RepID=A0ABS8G5B9_9ALTE|nr:diguanylate cyclase [Aestuariibacter halophilus]MCC2615787.1 diguanylate cyclase [Aestuariibacter halophilus]
MHVKQEFQHFMFTIKKIATPILLLLSVLASTDTFASVDVNRHSDGDSTINDMSVWFDPSNELTVQQADTAWHNGEFSPLSSKGSTGLRQGAVWARFTLHNTERTPLTLHLEYVDHQVIGIQAFAQGNNAGMFEQIADLSLRKPFSTRQYPHHRFVFETQIPAGQSRVYYIKYISDGMGFTFPALRVWEPNHLRATQTIETSAIAFLLGGFFLMSIFAFVGGIATGERFFYIYSFYSLSKITAWATILGFTHQFILTTGFHWSYMSMTGAITIFFGLLFARNFLQTKEHTPRLDWVLLLMMANAIFLFVCAIFKLTTLTVVSITIALLLYPVMSVIGIRRWIQGSKEAAVFALAWSFLVIGLVVQALRDIGLVEHNFFNYYWPPFASYTEMVVIMAAMGVKVRGLRRQKDRAEQRYTEHLERSKAELEELVMERTRDLEQAKHKAEQEARTDALTGTRNRRSFFAESERLLQRCKTSDITFSLLMFDIDHFKSINDNFGHVMGDEALRAFATAIGSKLRDSDVFGRIGGEEFSLLLCGSKEEAMQTADRLRQEIADLHIDTPKGPLTLTTSVGVAHLTNETLLDELVNLADKALYSAKQSGRNKVVECDQN